MSFTIKVNDMFVGNSTGVSVYLLNGAILYDLLSAQQHQIMQLSGKFYRVDSTSARTLGLSTTLGTWYLAGPMRGKTLHNFPTFLTAAAYLRSIGFEIVNPADHDLKQGFDMTKTLEEQKFNIQGALGWDFKQIIDCDGIILLDGWEHSMGAKAERLVATMTGKPALRLDEALKLFSEDEWISDLNWTTKVKPAPESGAPRRARL